MIKLLPRLFQKSIFSGLLLMLPLHALAAPDCGTNNPDPNLGVQAFDMPADGNPIGIKIGNTGSDRESRVFDGRGSQDCYLVRGWATPANPAVLGVSYNGTDGQVYDVFETGIDGIGYSIGIRDYADTNGIYRPLKAFGDTITFDGPQRTESMGYDVQITFVITGQLKTGSYPLSNKILANFFARTDTNAVASGAYIEASAVFEITARTCSLNNGDQFTMTLPPAAVSDFAGVSVGAAPSVAASNVVVISLNCQNDIALYATMTDSNDPTSTENYLSPGTATGTATGVGVQMFYEGSALPISMGPDSSAPDNMNQWFIQNTGATGSIVSFSLQSRYVRTGTAISSGPVRAIATMTFSYR